MYILYRKQTNKRNNNNKKEAWRRIKLKAIHLSNKLFQMCVQIGNRKKKMISKSIESQSNHESITDQRSIKIAKIDMMIHRQIDTHITLKSI